jgi:hypothetical protein
MNKFSSFILNSIDLFPAPIQITYQRKNSYFTKVSHLISVGLITLILYLVITEAYYTISLVNPEINMVFSKYKDAEVNIYSYLNN